MKPPSYNFCAKLIVSFGDILYKWFAFCCSVLVINGVGCDLFITVGQGITYWGEAYINFRPNKAYEKGFLKIEREGGIYINTNKFNLDSLIFCVDRCDDTEIEIHDTKTIRDFINTIKSIIENPHTKGEMKSNLIEALATQDFSLLDAGDCDYIFQKCIFGSCVYG